MNIKSTLFFTVKDLYPVLDKGVVVEFRRMIIIACIGTREEHKEDEAKFQVYVKYSPLKPKLDLEDEKLSIAHELTHAFLIEKGVREPKTKEANFRREDQIEEHAQWFRGKDTFFRDLVKELMNRRNCGVVFHGSIFDENGKTECPFLYYYCKLAQWS